MKNVKVNHVANSFFILLFKNPRMAAWPNVKGLKPSRGTAATRLYAVSIRG